MLAQATLRESEERFRLIANSAPVPIWVTKLDRTRSFANQAYLDFLGLPFEEAIVFDWRKRLHPDDQQRIVQESVAGEASLKPFVLEARYQRADGEWRWLRSDRSRAGIRPRYRLHRRRPRHHSSQAGRARFAPAERNPRTADHRADGAARIQRSPDAGDLRDQPSVSGLLNQHGDSSMPTDRACRIRCDAGDVIGKPFWETPWFSGTEGMRDAVRDAFIAVMRGEEIQTEMRLHLPIGERYFDFAMRRCAISTARSSARCRMPSITERRQEEVLRRRRWSAVGAIDGGVAHDSTIS